MEFFTRRQRLEAGIPSGLVEEMFHLLQRIPSLLERLKVGFLPGAVRSGKERARPPAASGKVKVIGVGFHKTGTKTLAECMKTLGYRHLSVSRRHFDLWLAGNVTAMLDDMESADSFEDWPWPLIFRQVNERFPDARFILTVRRDERTWFQSLQSHVQRQPDHAFAYRRFIYGCVNPGLDPEHHMNVYRCHNQTVRNFFSEQPDRLLEVCWETGDGWDELCGFLGEPIPADEFPHRNRKPRDRAPDPLEQASAGVISDSRRP